MFRAYRNGLLLMFGETHNPAGLIYNLSSFYALEREMPQLQEIAGKTWKKEDELKQLKSELAALDRKIQLALAPKHGETLDKGQEQGGSQDLLKVENVPMLDDTARDYIRDHIIIGRPEMEHREVRGVKL